jgi:hypothetical protein
MLAGAVVEVVVVKVKVKVEVEAVEAERRCAVRGNSDGW